jgi:fructose-1,6-bisphosphatase/inositol monophosphatase family enzyme
LTFAPTTGEEFFAEAGGGLLVNGGPARVSATPSLAQSVWGIDMGYDDARAARLIGLLAEVWPGVQSVRVMGSAALGLAYAACGRYDLFVHHYLFPWDIAPGIVLVREGGGQIVSRDGEPITIYSEGVVAGAPGPVQDFLRRAQGKAWR